MNRASTAREALIVEALGDVALLLDRVESLTASMEAARSALASANADLADRLQAFDASLSSMTERAKVKAIEHIVLRTGEACRQSIETQTRAMNAAARLAFAGQAESAFARLTSSLQQLIARIDRPVDLWLSHAATAVSSAALTWLLITAPSFR